MKKAFTMLELIMVIVVIGILAAVMLPRVGSNSLREAAIQLVAHIRYTQHLAMVDDKFDVGDSKWYKSRWQIVFNKGAKADYKLAYTIYSDGSGYTGSASSGEIAIDPADKSKLLSGGSAAFDVRTDSRANKKLNLGMSYGIITDIADLMTGGCLNESRITFDNIGRPIEGVIKDMTNSYEAGNLLTSRCIITLNDTSDSIQIGIEPETGYACILNTAGTGCI